MSVRVEVPGAVRGLVERLEGAGFETWIVGGAVRDAIVGRPANSAVAWDLATAASPSRVRRLFRRTVPLGLEYGTVGVFGADGVLHEVTTFRRDVATFGRKATVAFGHSLSEDLARRDFTVNAMAWHPLRGELRDPHEGRADIEAGVLRAVGAASKRFREDYLRVLRGFRFAGALDLRVEPATWAGMVESVPGLAHLSMERVREELMKTMSGAHPSRTLALYQKSGAFGQLLPEMAAPLAPAALAAVDSARACRPILRMAVLLLYGLGGSPLGESTPSGRRDAGATAGKLLRRLRFSNAERATVAAAMAGGLAPDDRIRSSDASRRRWAAELGGSAAAARAAVRDVFRLWIAVLRSGADCPGALQVLREVRRDMRDGVPMSVAELAVGGGDLIELGWTPGPRLGEALGRLLDAVWRTPSLNERTRLLRLAAEFGPPDYADGAKDSSGSARGACRQPGHADGAKDSSAPARGTP